MKKVVFIGLSNKKDKEPFDKTTNSGKIINEVINHLDCKCFKINLVPYAPLNESGKLRYPTKEEIAESINYLNEQLENIKPDCIVGLGNMVNKELKKIEKYQNILICETHPSYVYVYKKRELNQYIKNLEKKIMSQLLEKSKN